MSSFGSSAINKSAKKLAPKVQVRRRPGPSGPVSQPSTPALSATSARSSVDPQPSLTQGQTIDDGQHLADEALISRAGNETSQGARDVIEASLERQTARQLRDEAARRDEAQATTGAPRYRTTTATPERRRERTGSASASDHPRLQDVPVATTERPATSLEANERVRQQSINATNSAVNRSREDPGARSHTPSGSGIVTGLDAESAARLRDANVNALAAGSASSNAASRRSSLGDVGPTAAPNKRKRQSTKAAANKRARVATSERASESAESSQADGNLAGEGIAPSIEGSPLEDQPAKKPRKVRKDKGVSRKKKPAQTQAQDVPDQGNSRPASEAASTPSQEPRRSARRATSEAMPAESETSAGGNASDSEQQHGEPQVRQRVRKATPEENEDVEIDPTRAHMGDFCHPSKIGKVSTLERRMREVNWEEVRQRRRAAQAAPVEEAPNVVDSSGENADAELQASAAGAESAEDEEAEEEEEDEEQPVPSRVRIINGVATVVEAAMEVDRHVDADQEIANAEVLEEEDITQRITSVTWLDARRRDENERRYGRKKSDRWSAAETDAFYDALRMFGTDFFIVSKMVPSKSRRNIKAKFVREEHEDPERVQAALIGERVPMNLGVYSEASGITEFKDADKVKEEMAEIERQRQEEIVLAREEREAEERQRRAMEGDDGTAIGDSAKENAAPDAATVKKAKSGSRRKKGKEPATNPIAHGAQADDRVTIG